MKHALALLLFLLASQAAAKPLVGIQYVAHACFVIESSAGTRIAIDPYSDHVWLGYSFPEEPPPADAILVTHPHFDHDASYHWPAEIPIFRRPGQYAVEDVRLTGIVGRHSDPYGEEFGQTNTIWIVEVDGLRIVHLGDNRGLDAELIAKLGRVDMLMLPVDSTFHILQRREVDDLLARLKPRVIVPMHYLIPELAAEVDGLGPIDPWLEAYGSVIRLAGSTTRLDPDALPVAGTVLVFQPAAGVAPWSADYLEARETSAKARVLAREGDDKHDEVIAHLRRAVDLASEWPNFAIGLARQLVKAERREEAVQVLERSLAGAGRADWSVTARARYELARLYLEMGDVRRAKQQARLILARSWGLELRRKAEEILEH